MTYYVFSGTLNPAQSTQQVIVAVNDNTSCHSLRTSKMYRPTRREMRNSVRNKITPLLQGYRCLFHNRYAANYI